MKKRILIPIFLLVLTLSASAQKGLYVGAGGSVLSTWITNQNNYGQVFEMDYEHRIGSNGHINLGYDFNASIGLKLEAGYGMLGQKYKDMHKDTIYTRTINLNYFQLPLLFKFRTAGEKVKFYVMAGPQFNFLMSAKQEYYKREKIYSDSILNPINAKRFKIGEEDVKNRYSSMDIMARIDLGVDIYFIPNLYLNAGLTMAYGLIDINAEEFRIPDHSSGEYNPSHNLYGGLNVGIQYRIPLSKK